MPSRLTRRKPRRGPERVLVLKDGRAFAAMQECLDIEGWLSRSAAGRASLAETDRLLDEDAVWFVSERDSSPTVATDHFVTLVKPSEGFERLLAALRAKKAHLVAAGVGNPDNGYRNEVGAVHYGIPPYQAAPLKG